MKAPVATLTAIISGTIVLVLSFILVPEAVAVRGYMVTLAAILMGVAALVGILNLAAAHWQRLFHQDKKDYSSLVLLLSFTVTVVAGLCLSPADANFMKVVTAIQIPIETSLLAVLAVSLTFIAFRLLQRRRNLMGFVFVISFVVFLILGTGWLGNTQQIPVIGNLLMLLPQAGARGLLLGIGIASLLAGLRVLFGADRPYNG